MKLGQVSSVLVCDSTAPGQAVAITPAVEVCPAGQTLFLIPSYLPTPDSASFIDGLGQPFDPVVASSIFGFGFGVVVFFFILGLKGAVLIRPFGFGRR